MHVRKKPLADQSKQAEEHELSAFCPRFQYAVELIGRRWVGAVLRTLMGGPRRFNEILAAIPGVSDRLLTERLRELEREGIVQRSVHAERPVRVTYELTACGRSLEPIMNRLAAWAETWVQLAG